MSKFSITQSKGFQLTFENGWTVSVQWGPGNYTDSYHSSGPTNWDAPKQSDSWESQSAEIAAWDSKGKWHQFDGDTVKGYVSTNEVAKFINKIANKKA